MASFSTPILHKFLMISLYTISWACWTGGSLIYNRPKARETLYIPLRGDRCAPQQVHISLAGPDKMRVSWITECNAEPKVEFGTSEGSYPFSASGSTTSYSYLRVYKSANIHEAVIGPLDPNTLYYYRCSSYSNRVFSFKTPPSQLPIKFAIVGDLGQTGWTNSTLEHVSKSEYDVLLLPGDLSYADRWQPDWDSFGRAVEPLASSRAWMVTEGNHEIEKVPFLVTPFKAYNARWRMPYDSSGSTSNLYYSFDVAGGAVHVLMLGSYAKFGPDSKQYMWLVGDLVKIDRRRTPWVVAVLHAPWYNSNKAHRGEGRDMRRAMEDLLYQARVDVVFAGHVHAYERFARVYDRRADECGPVHITIGDGGNKEGLAKRYIEPKPGVSLFREASFGHGEFDIVNGTHALWTWHRNDDDQAVVADQVWLTSLPSNRACNKKY